MATRNVNKVKFRLKRAYYATIVEAEDDSGVKNVTYAAPNRLPGAVSISVSPEGEMKKFNADATVYYQTAVNNGYTAELELALIPDGFRLNCLGEEVSDAGDVFIERSSAEPKPFALLFEFEGDKKAIKHVLYYCYASRTSIEGENPENKEVKTETVSITALPREQDDLVKARTSETATDEFLQNWYNKVWLPSEVAE